MCLIQIIDSIMGSTLLVVDICDNMSALRKYLVHPESVTLWQKQEDIISHLSDVYQSIESGIFLVHVYEHNNSWSLASNFLPLAYINVQLDPLA